MNEAEFQICGFKVICRFDPLAAEIVHRFFGRGRLSDRGQREKCEQNILLTIRITDDGELAPVGPPCIPSNWESVDPLVLDVASSHASVSQHEWSVELDVAKSDIGNQIVWGRWLLEKAFLVLTLRSPKHYGLHAGAIVIESHPVVVVADGGVGKSTFVTWALRRGAVFVTDDVLVRHLHDSSGEYWGYTRAAHITKQVITGWRELEGAAMTPVPQRDKFRVEWPSQFENRLTASIIPKTLAILTRDHFDVRQISLDEVIQRRRSDFAAGMHDPSVLDEIESDLRSRLAETHLIELGLSRNYDANLEALKATILP